MASTSNTAITVVVSGIDTKPEWFPESCKHKLVLTGIDNNKCQGYLKYIIDNYEKLEDYSIFLDKNPFNVITISRDEFLKALCDEPCILYDRSSWTTTLRCLSDGRPHHPGLNLNHWFSLIFPGQQGPNAYEFIAGSQFMISSSRIRSNSKSYYENLLNLSNQNGLDDFTMERLWHIVFFGVPKPQSQ